MLEPDCADDENSYAWSITLNPESNQNIELSFAADFSGSWTTDFVTSGTHSFTTPRGGSTLYVRYVSDHGASDSAAANGELCEPPTESEPEGSVGGGTGTPAASIPDTSLREPGVAGPLGTIGFGMVLLASLGALAYANTRVTRERP